MFRRGYGMGNSIIPTKMNRHELAFAYIGLYLAGKISLETLMKAA
jgi:hypothetical protein